MEIKLNYFKHISMIIILLIVLIYVAYNLHFTDEYLNNPIAKITGSVAVVFLGFWGIWKQLKILKFPVQIRLNENGIEYFEFDRMRFDNWNAILSIKLHKDNIVEIQLIDKSIHSLALSGLNRSSDSSYRLIMKYWDKYKTTALP